MLDAQTFQGEKEKNMEWGWGVEYQLQRNQKTSLSETHGYGLCMESTVDGV